MVAHSGENHRWEIRAADIGLVPKLPVLPSER